MSHRAGAGRNSGRAGGFTLVELLVVIAIIALLIGILLPVLGNVRRNAKKTATQALMTTVGASIDAFKIDNKRMPGYFSQRDLASVSGNDENFTAMENALIELMGGQSPGGDISVEINGRELRIDPAAIGGKGGPGYLTLGANQGEGGGSVLTAWQPQDSPNDLRDGMPDVLDTFGAPLTLWIKDSANGADDDYASIRYSTGGDRAYFYWQCNAGYLDPDISGGSGGLLDGGVGDDDRISGIEAVTGHPAFPEFPIASGSPRPAQPRGEYVIHSAGPDSVFLEQSSTSIQRGAYKPANYEGTLRSGSASLDEFDDLVVGGG